MTTPIPQPPKYQMKDLQDYLILIEHLTGKKPKTVEVSTTFKNWYKAQIKSLAKNFNIPTTKNFKKLEFMGVELK